jgi:hypothetical protein
MNYGVGLDIGTMNIICARRDADDQLVLRRVRDTFLDLEPDAKKMLKLTGTNYVEYQDRLVIVGDAALQTANIMKRDVRRPLSRGIISPSEMGAIEILQILIGQVLDKPAIENEVCYFSTPAAPIDDITKDVIYHANVFKRIISNLGYVPKESNEAQSIVFSECADSNFSGIGISYGAGMVNAALVFQTMTNLSFSISKGGDWIDNQASKALGETPSRICAIKEKGKFDLHAPRDRNEEAIAIYYKALIDESLKAMVRKVGEMGSLDFPHPIPIVLAGGTSLADGFLTLFKELFEPYRKKLSFEVGEIRVASNQLNCISEGLLLQALQEYDT